MKTIETFVKRVVTVQPGAPLAEVAQLMEEQNVGAVVIVEGDRRPVGIVTDRDLALGLGAHGLSPQTAVAQVMSTPVHIVHRDDGVFDTTQAMRETGVRRIPVVDDEDRLVGLVTLDDLLSVLSRELSNLTEGIRSEMAMPQQRVRA